MKRLMFLVAGLFPALLAAQEPIRIGVSLPLTGEAMSYGADMKNALEFANQKLAGGKYELVFEDDRCSGKDAVTVAQKLTRVDKVSYVTGFGCSGALLAAAPVYEKTKTVVVASSTSSAEVTNAGDHIFRVCPSDKLTARELYDVASRRHKSFGVLSEETDYAQTLAKAFLGRNTAMRIVEDSYLPQTTDFRSLLAKFRASGVEGMFLNTQAEGTLAVLVKQIRELKWNAALYAVYWPSSKVFIDAVGGLAEGMVYIDMPAGAEIFTPQGQQVYDEYLRQYGTPNSADFFIYLTYMAFHALDRAISSGEEVKDYLYKTKFESIAGPYSFDAHGDVLGIGHVLKEIRGGKGVLLRRLQDGA